MKQSRIEVASLDWDFLETVLEHVQDGIYITDSEANTIYINHKYELLTGLSKAEMLGKNMQELVEKGIVSVSGTLKVLETGKSITIEQGFRTGKRAVITSSPIYTGEDHSSHIFLVMTVVREITELYSVRKELHRLEQKNQQYAVELNRLNSELNEAVEIVAVDQASLRLTRLAERLAILDAPVLIYGEAGVGKEKTARFIHHLSKRRESLFMRIDFSVIPKNDAVRYLFGYEDTEKEEYHMGILESADGGTVYLDEIAEIPPAVKGHFLSLLRDGSCVLGDGRLHKLDIRFIAGSKYSLEELEMLPTVEKDLTDYFSLFPLQVLPLRERRGDIIPLLEYFLKQYQRKTGEKKHFSRECYEKLQQYDWPGNVREAYVLVQRSAIVSGGEEISVSDLGLSGEEQQRMEISEQEKTAEDGNPALEVRMDDRGVELKQEVAKLEAQYMNLAFSRYQNIRIAAEKLGMDSSTFVRKRQRYEKMGLMDKQRKK